MFFEPRRGRVAALTLSAFFSGGVVAAQSGGPEFDVASVKPIPPLSGNLAALLEAAGRRLPAGQWRLRGLTLQNAIILAYPQFRLPGLLIGGPDWMRETRFDLQARMSPTATHAEVQTMFRRLLEDRFALRTHLEQRTLDVYLLTLKTPGTLGPGLTPAPIPCVVWRLTGGRAPDQCNLYRTRGGEGAFTASAVSVSEFITAMTMVAAINASSMVGPTGIDRPVMDRTGLEGYFQIIGPSPMSASGPVAEQTGSFFTLMEEQLGVKLARAKEMVDVLVIDSVSMPEPD